MIIKAYKIRCYPTREQEILFAKTEGCCRFVWNKSLRLMSEAYADFKQGIRDKALSTVDVSRELTQWKKTQEMAFLAEVPSDSLSQELRDLDTAFRNFFSKRAKYPRPKRKHTGCAVRLVFDHRHAGKVRSWQKREMVLPGFGSIRLAQPERITPRMPKMITLRRDSAGRFFVSYSVEQPRDPPALTGRAVGVDVNIKHLAVLSNGEKVEGAKALKRRLRYLRSQGRRLSRKVKGSNRWKKQRLKVARIHARISDARADSLHQLSHRLTHQYDVIALEDLHVKGMVKNRRLARHLMDQSFGEFRRQMEYKADWKGKQIILADRWAPTSKMCSFCGITYDGLTLKMRDWRCPVCDTHHDRDINAAQNVLDFARSKGGQPLTDARGGWTIPNSGVIGYQASDEARTKPGHTGGRMDRQQV